MYILRLMNGKRMRWALIYRRNGGNCSPTYISRTKVYSKNFRIKTFMFNNL